jgi:antitoxin component of MazEF toxin-antitoxin module
MTQVIEKKLKRWGNAQAVIVPNSFIRAAKWSEDQALEVVLTGSTVTIKPVAREETAMDRVRKMFEGVTPDMVGGEFIYGVVGKEML